MHKHIQNQLNKASKGIELEIIHPDNILIVAPEWLEMDSESNRAFNLSETINLITANCRKLL